MKIAIRVLAGLTVLVMTAWAAEAIYYSPIPGESLRVGVAGIFVLATVFAFVRTRNLGRALVGYLVIFAAIVALWLQIRASNDRERQPEVALAPYVTISR